LFLLRASVVEQLTLYRISQRDAALLAKSRDLLDYEERMAERGAKRGPKPRRR
jgi:hypothetical protein